MDTELPLWRKIQRQNFTNLSQLADFLEWEKELFAQLLFRPRFPLNLPRRLAKKIQKNTLNDPILKQFVPLCEETRKVSAFSTDPIREREFRQDAKLLQKYNKRALLLLTSACAMNCRFCFRQNFPYETHRKDYEFELERIERTPSLNEIILSGGDPLSLSNEDLAFLLNSLNAITHIKRIRFHSRFPIGIPERIDDRFLSILSSLTKQVIFVLHVNHLKELDDDIYRALRALSKQGIPILTQTVLLRGINDSVSILEELFEGLANHGIIPYYLHQLDRIQGAAHFEVPVIKGKKLISTLRSRLSGYALPGYVQEVPGHTSKKNL